MTFEETTNESLVINSLFCELPSRPSKNKDPYGYAEYERRALPLRKRAIELHNIRIALNMKELRK